MQHLKTVLVVLVLLIIGYLLLPYVKIEPKTQNEPQIQGNSTELHSAVESFTSEKFGITFQFEADQDGDGIKDTTKKEEGDKIYVYYEAGPVEQGQWVQVFTKNPDESLETAIKNKLLSGISEQDCFVESFSTELPSNIVTTQIAYNYDPNASLEEILASGEKCPTEYRLTNGIRYFTMDKNHPDRFFFFSIGQYGILSGSTNEAGEPTTWQDTFQVK